MTILPIIFRGHSDSGFFVHSLGLCPDKKPVALLPGNQRSKDAPYVCVIVVRDYFRMNRARAHKSGVWHYSDLEVEIIDDVRSGRSVILFDLCNEGPSYDRTVFSELNSWIETNKLPPGRCIWLAQNRAIGLDAKRYIAAPQDLVRFDYYDFFVKAVAWAFSPHSREKLVAENPEEYIERLFEPRRKDKLLLCLNATPRLSRVLTVACLQHHGLIADSLVSFPGMQYIKAGTTITDVLDFIDRNPKLEYLRSSVECVGNLPELKVDLFEEKGNALVTKIDPTVYERTYFSLVTETTNFSDPKAERVTEKLTKAYCMGHPSLVVGNINSVQFMTSLGFQDWSDVMHRDSDAVVDPVSRFELVIQEALRQSTEIKNDKAAWLKSVSEVGTYNVRHAASGRLVSEYIKSFDAPVVNRLKSMLRI
jgi:hypothetical protein